MADAAAPSCCCRTLHGCCGSPGAEQLLCRTLQLDAVLGSCAGRCSGSQCWAPGVGRTELQGPSGAVQGPSWGTGQVLQGAEITEILLLGCRGTFPHGAARPGAARGPSGAGRAPGAAGSLMETFCAGARGSFNGDGPSGAPSRLLWALLSQHRTQQSPPPNPPQPLSELWVQSPPGCEEGLSCPPQRWGLTAEPRTAPGSSAPPANLTVRISATTKRGEKKGKKQTKKEKGDEAADPSAGTRCSHPSIPAWGADAAADPALLSIPSGSSALRSGAER